MVLLKDGLEEFVTERLRSRYGDSWTGEARAIVYRNMPQAAPKGGGIQWDVYGLLTVITVRWTDCFASVLSKRARSLVEELRATRNEIAHQHFHAEDEPRAMDSAKRLLGEIETDAAKNASARIESIQSHVASQSAPPPDAPRTSSTDNDRPLNRSSKYASLKEWLISQGTERVEMTFAKIGEIVGDLPKSAFEYPAWWANQKGQFPQSKAWREAGYRVDMLDLNGKRVRFVRDRN